MTDPNIQQPEYLKMRQEKFGDYIIATRTSEALMLCILNKETIENFQRVIDAYLNTRPEAPKWLFDLSDALNPNPVPARKKDGFHELE